MKTRYANVYSLGDGTFERETALSPINYVNPDTGGFESIDTALESRSVTGSPDPVFSNRANDFRLSLPARMGRSWTSIETSRARIAFRPATRSLPGFAEAADSTGTPVAMRADERRYPGAFGSADIEYTSMPDGLKETIVLGRRTGESVFSFDLAATGVEPRVQPDGSISMISADSTVAVASMPAPYMWDSHAATQGPAPAESRAVRYEISGSAPLWRLDVVADAEWLASPERVYPVRIDPTLYLDYTDDYPADAFVSSALPTYNWGTSHNDLRIGWEGSTYGNCIAFLKTNDAFYSGAYKDSVRVIDSDLRLYNYSMPTPPDTLYCSKVTEDWSDATVTYNNQPAYGAVTDSPQVSANAWADLQITGEADSWVQGTSPNYGVALYQTATTSEYGVYRSAHYSAAYSPRFVTRYSLKPLAVLEEPASDVSADNTPVVRWRYFDTTVTATFPTGTRSSSTQTLGYKGQRSYRIQVCTDGSTILADTGNTVSAAATALAPVPSGGWVNGQRYFIRIQLSGASGDVDHPDVWSDWTQWTPFRIESLTHANDGAGIEAYRASTAIGAGASVDLSNGHLALSRGDFTGPSLGPALSFGATYDSALSTDSGFGTGWREGVSSLVLTNNVAPDPGFESGISSWHPAGAATYAWSRVTDVKRSGMASLRLSSSVSTVPAASATPQTSARSTWIECLPGDAIDASVWAKTGATYAAGRSIAGVHGVGVRVRFYDAGGAYLSEQRSGNLTKAGADWTLLRAAAIAPERAYYAKVAIEGATFAGDVWFDDALIDTHEAILAEGDGTTRHLRQAGGGTWERDPLSPQTALSRVDLASDATVGAEPASLGGVNLVPEGSFDGAEYDKWYESSPGSTSQSTVTRTTGGRSAWFWAGSYANVHLATAADTSSVDISVSGIPTLTASAWMNTAYFYTDPAQSWRGASLQMYFYDNAGTLKGSAKSEDLRSLNTSGWVQAKVSAPVPSGATKVKLNVEYRAAKGYLYVDDVVLSAGALVSDKSIDGKAASEPMDYDMVPVSASGTNALRYDLGSSRTLDEIDLHLWEAEDASALQSPTVSGVPVYTYRVEASENGTQWSRIAPATGTSVTGSSHMVHELAAPVRARFLRVVALDDGFDGELRIAELDCPQTRVSDAPVLLDDSGHVAAVSDTSGNRTTYARDSSGRLLCARDAAGRVMTVNRSSGRITSLDFAGKDSSGATQSARVAEYAYSGDRLATVTVDGVAIAYGYDAQGRLASVTDADGVAATIGYDASSRVASVTGADGSVTSIAYGSGYADVTSQGGTSAQNSRIEFSAAAGNQITRVIADPQGPCPQSTQVAYDVYGHVNATTDAKGRVTRIERDGHGNALRAQDSSGRVTSATYVNDRVHTATDVKGNLSVQSYDEAWRPLVSSFMVTDPDGDGVSSAREGYDAWGNPTSSELPASTSHNVLVNSTFEQTPTSGGGWSYSAGAPSWVLTATPVTRGIGAHYMALDASESVTSDEVTVTAGKVYAFSALSSGNGEVRLREYNSGGTLMAETKAQATSAPGTSEFVRVAGTAVLRADTKTVALRLFTNTAGAKFDDARVELADASGAMNLVENESIEVMSGVSVRDWTPRSSGLTSATQVADTSDHVEGARSLKIDTTGGKAVGYFVGTFIPVTPGEHYTASAWVRTDRAAAYPGGASVFLEAFDANKAVMYSSYQYVTPKGSSVSGTNAWTRYVSDVVVPPNVRYLRANFNFGAGGGTGWCDSVSLEPAANTESYEYDSATHTFKTSTTTTGGRKARDALDFRGRLITSTVAASATAQADTVVQNAFDSKGRLAKVTSAPGAGQASGESSATYTYTEAGRLKTVTGPRGAVSTLDYDTAGRVERVTSPLGWVSKSLYDGLGRVTAILWPARSAEPSVAMATNHFDSLGRIDRVTYHDRTGEAVATRTVTFDSGSVPIAERISGPVSASATKTLDSLDRVTRLNASGPAGQVTLTAAYDVADLPVTSTWSFAGMSGSLANTYTATNVWRRTTVGGRDWDFAYGVGGELLSVVSSGLASATWGYDDAHRLSSLRTGLKGAGGAYERGWRDYSITLDGRDRIASVRGVGETTSTLDSYQYDSADRLISWDGVQAGVSTNDESYEYDSSGNMTRRTRQGQAETFVYDSEDKLTSATLAGVTTDYGYDELGRLTTESAGAETTSYAWNTLGQLETVRGREMTATYLYGADGMRAVKVIDRGGVTTTETAIWSGGALVAQKLDDGTVLEVVRGPGGVPLSLRERRGAVTTDYAYLLDAGGSVTGLADANGTVVAQYRYDPWGQPLSAIDANGSGIAQRNPLRYRGYCWDEDSGLYYLQARYYAPQIGRFISPDPASPQAGIPISLNAYAYCEDDPVNGTDATGTIADFDDDGRVDASESAYHAASKATTKELRRHFRRKMIEWQGIEKRRRAYQQGKALYYRGVREQRTDVQITLGAVQKALLVDSLVLAAAGIAVATWGAAVPAEGVWLGAIAGWTASAEGAVAYAGVTVGAWRFAAGDPEYSRRRLAVDAVGLGVGRAAEGAVEAAPALSRLLRMELTEAQARLSTKLLVAGPAVGFDAYALGEE